jgi:hypothetical protein
LTVDTSLESLLINDYQSNIFCINHYDVEFQKTRCEHSMQ